RSVYVYLQPDRDCVLRCELGGQAAGGQQVADLAGEGRVGDERRVELRAALAVAAHAAGADEIGGERTRADEDAVLGRVRRQPTVVPEAVLQAEQPGLRADRRLDPRYRSEE